MPLINLIQEQRIAAAKLEQKARMAFFTFVGSAAVVALGAGYLFMSRQGLQVQISNLNSEVKKYAPVVAEIEDIDKESSSLQPRLQTLFEAQKATDRWNKILRYLTTQTPPDTWLTGMHSTGLQADKPVNMVLTGTAKAQEPIGEFILRVENEPDLENVMLHFTQQKLGSGGKEIDFEVAADLSGTAEAKKQPPKEEQKS